MSDTKKVANDKRPLRRFLGLLPEGLEKKHFTGRVTEEVYKLWSALLTAEGNTQGTEASLHRALSGRDEVEGHGSARDTAYRVVYDLVKANGWAKVVSVPTMFLVSRMSGGNPIRLTLWAYTLVKVAEEHGKANMEVFNRVFGDHGVPTPEGYAVAWVLQKDPSIKDVEDPKRNLINCLDNWPEREKE